MDLLYAGMLDTLGSPEKRYLKNICTNDAGNKLAHRIASSAEL
jgi:hypothetical protein